MLTCKQIFKDIEESQCCYVFDYKGQPCGIDPVSGEFNVWYGDNDLRAKKWEDVITAKFFDGKALPDILGDIENYGLG